MQSVHYDQQWVMVGDPAQSALVSQGYGEFMREMRYGKPWALMAKRKPDTRLNTADEYERKRIADAKRNAAAQMKHDVETRIAKGQLRLPRQDRG